MPVIALFSGCRVNEISQLYCTDIKDSDGIIYLDINANAPDKRIKNKQSERLVPLHPILRRLGFHIYAREQAEQGHTRVFHELTYNKQSGYGGDVSSWFSHWKRSRITDYAVKTFHSFRKNFTDQLIAVETPGNFTHDILGWKKEGKMLHLYAGKTEVEKLAPYVAKVKYSVDLNHLKDSKYARKEKRRIEH
jgi:integrase